MTASDYPSILIVPSFHQSAKFGKWVGATVEKNPWNVYKTVKFTGNKLDSYDQIMHRAVCHPV